MLKGSKFEMAFSFNNKLKHCIADIALNLTN